MPFRYALALVVLLAAAAAAFTAQSKDEPRSRSSPEARKVMATAYCIDGETKSGVETRKGIVAADPAWLPLGSRIRVTGLGSRHNGDYTVADTGPAVKGREIDIYMSSCAAAKRFGRKPARVTVLRRGWGPGGPPQR
jgi:3D (Asp-Asp-Asp) domain-containing protein